MPTNPLPHWLTCASSAILSPFPSMRLAVLLSLMLLANSAVAQEAVDMTPVKKWIALQKDLRTVEADFTQTRSIRALRSPVSSPGKLWLTHAGEIRWEIGVPLKTVFLRRKDTCLLIQPQKQRFTVLSAESDSAFNPQSFPMMELPIATSFADFAKRFEVLQVKPDGKSCQLEFLPREPQARKFLKSIRVQFDTEDGRPHFFEVLTKDGAALKNEFSNVRLNQKLDRAIFDFDLNGYQSDSQK